MDNDAARECLRRGDVLVRAGDIAGAVREYLAYAMWVEGVGFALKAVAVRKQVLTLAPERRDVRRRLAEGYITLGLLDHARTELARVASEAELAGDDATREEALARARSIT